MTRYARHKGKNAPHKPRINKTKNRIKDLDEIHDDLEKNGTKRKHEYDEDLPGAGQHYCAQCGRHFIDDQALGEHRRSKLHKQRVKALKEDPYSHEEAETAAGLGNYKRRKVIHTETTE
ncbi:zinc finger protein-like protein [Leptotrombidium deliense]|uniref:Zinc finger protein 593 homolog n=1 Tax=Leptotrombidium deliense TaxID=299467 RepID=A0A443S6W4_9ACAR|nr:zinc finger protein-like protein [Leptotrombidium deliense]